MVKSLHEGKFTESKPRHGGYGSFDQGPTAVLSTTEGLTVVATSRRIIPFSLAQLTSCGLDPAKSRTGSPPHIGQTARSEAPHDHLDGSRPTRSDD